MRNPEVHYRWCLEKCGGDDKTALLMMESVVEANGENVNYKSWFLWCLSKKMESSTQISRLVGDLQLAAV